MYHQQIRADSINDIQYRRNVDTENVKEWQKYIMILDYLKLVKSEGIHTIWSDKIRKNTTLKWLRDNMPSDIANNLYKKLSYDRDNEEYNRW